MSKVDWSKAPEGATFYAKGCYWREFDGVLHINLDSHWHNSNWGIDKLKLEFDYEKRPEPITGIRVGDYIHKDELNTNNPEIPGSSNIESTLEQRGHRYGEFEGGASIMQDLKEIMRATDGWERLNQPQREALEMIQHKIGRILNGDPNYDDNWRDICGYSQLILNQLTGE